jgi:hypothetical protein
VRHLITQAVRARRVRTLGACLVAAFALGVFGAAGASAKSTLPEWGGCELSPSHEGRYGNANCTDPVKPLFGKPAGAWEWVTGAAFHDEFGIEGYRFFPVIGPSTFETTAGKKITCTGGDGDTRITLGNAPNEVKNILLTFTGCESEAQPCTSPQTLQGIGGITNEAQWGNEQGLKGKLVFVAGKKTATPTVGLELESFDNSSETEEQRRLLTANCAGAIETVWLGQGASKTGKNTVIALITPVDQMSTVYTQTFAQSAPGVQDPSKLEHGSEIYLQEFVNHNWERSAWTSTWTDIAEEEAPPIEIKAVK